MRCVDCGKETHTSYGKYNNDALCDACYKQRYHNELEEQSKSLQCTSDFKNWRSGDMSELFWLHLGRYVKEPNEHSLRIIAMAFRWACHDNHGLANSFSNAMKWAKIDLHVEERKWREKQNREVRR